jgi:hypothetical protein
VGLLFPKHIFFKPKSVAFICNQNAFCFSLIQLVRSASPRFKPWACWFTKIFSLNRKSVAFTCNQNAFCFSLIQLVRSASPRFKPEECCVYLQSKRLLLFSPRFKLWANWLTKIFSLNRKSVPFTRNQKAFCFSLIHLVSPRFKPWACCFPNIFSLNRILYQQSKRLLLFTDPLGQISQPTV